MFCPKCGSQNSETGKFCRTCGTDLSPVSEALAGRAKNKKGLKNKNNFGEMNVELMQPFGAWDKKGKSPSWESMISTSFVGFAFLIISIILGVTGAANASRWWFWLLIPAFAMLGTGLAQYIQLKKNEQKLTLPTPPQESPARTLNEPVSASLPPTRTEYVVPDSRYKTGDLVPPSVIENTTRHLEMNSEGETITLPKNNVS